MPDISATRRACASASPTISAFCSPVEARRPAPASARAGPRGRRDAGRSGCARRRRRGRDCRAKHRAIAVLRLERRAARRSSPRPRLRAQASPRERARSRRARRRSAPRAGARIRAARRRRRRRARPPRARSRRASAALRPTLLEEPVAPAQRPLELADPRAVIGVDREHEPVEKAAPLARRPGEERIHRRRQPDDSHMVGEGARRGDGRAVDAVSPLRAALAVAPASSPSRADAARRSRRLRPRAQSRRRRHVGRIRRAPPGASPAPARTATALPGDWSCRRRSRRIGRRGGPRSRDRAPHRIGNPAASAAAREGAVARDGRRRGLPWRWRLPCPAAARKWELQAEWKRG